MRCSGIGESNWHEVAVLTQLSLFTKRHQKIIKIANWRYYLKEKKYLSSVKVALYKFGRLR